MAQDMMWILNVEPMARDMEWGEPRQIPYKDYPYHIRIRKGHEPRKPDDHWERTIDLSDYHTWAERHGLDMRHSLLIHGDTEDYKHGINFYFSKKSEAAFFKLVFYKNEPHRNRT